MADLRHHRAGRRGRALSAALLVALLLPAALPSAATQTLEPPVQPVRWLAAGDSYSSGEGIDRITLPCARSDQAYGPLAAETLEVQRSWQIDVVHLVACTGATGDTFYSSLTNAGQSQWGELQGMPGFRDSERYDVITLSFGGNDIGFAEVVKDCVPVAAGGPEDPGGWGMITDWSWIGDRCDQTQAALERRVAVLMEEDRLPLDDTTTIADCASGRSDRCGSLPDLWEAIADNHLADDGILVVLGYPRLFAPEWPPWRGARCQGFTKTDADMVGAVAETLDAAMEQAASSDPRIVYISLLDVYDDGGTPHSLCSRYTHWLNGVRLPVFDRVESGFHPNELGHRAAASHVAGRVEQRLGVVPAPPPTTATTAPATTQPAPVATTSPTIPAGSTFEVGDRFASQCVIAWPTAPMRTTTAIVMRMSCGNAPSQFLFVDVQYPDPDLPVSSRPMYVEGVIMDIADSGMGFRTLVVLADRIDL